MCVCVCVCAMFDTHPNAHHASKVTPTTYIWVVCKTTRPTTPGASSKASMTHLSVRRNPHGSNTCTHEKTHECILLELQTSSPVITTFSAVFSGIIDLASGQLKDKSGTAWIYEASAPSLCSSWPLLASPHHITSHMRLLPCTKIDFAMTAGRMVAGVVMIPGSRVARVVGNRGRMVVFACIV